MRITLPKTTQFKKIKKDMSQYDEFEKGEGLCVPARYIETVNSDLQYNMLVSALPPSLTEVQVRELFRKDLSTYSASEMKLPAYERKQKLLRLRSLRVPLPFDVVLANQFHNSLLNSYASRYLISRNLDVESSTEQNFKLLGNTADGTSESFSLLGKSGSGKSSAIASLLNYYPQVIEHKTEVGSFKQVVYLTVNCYTNGNLSEIYNGIAIALDRALGLDYIYENLLASKSRLPDKFDVIRRLVEQFAIGILILDEIQLMNFSANKSNSFESLMTLMNVTKVNIAVVGTEDARDKMFSVLRTARRFQIDIYADAYCSNKDFFKFIIRDVWHYQWFNEPIELTEDLLEALCECTHCIISQLICLLMYMNTDYLSYKKTPLVNGDYVRKVMNKYFKGVNELLKHLDMKSSDTKISEEISFKFDALIKSVGLSAQEHEMKYFRSRDQAKIDFERVLKEAVISNVVKCTQFNEDSLSKSYDKLLKITSNENKEELYLSRKLIEKMQSEG